MAKKIAFVDGNRAINKNNVKKHVESFKKFGKNLVPMLYVEATEIKGHTLYDAESGEVVAQDDYKDYWVILDGQHRYKAAQELAASEDANGFTLDALWWEKVNLDGKSFEDVLIEVNSRTQPWKGADYICGCVLQHPENEVAQFAQELVKQGVSGKTITKYLFFNDKFKWADAVVNVDAMTGANVQRAREIWEVVKQFPIMMKKSSIIIDFIIEGGNWSADLKKVAELPAEKKLLFETIKKNDQKNEFLKMMAE